MVGRLNAVDLPGDLYLLELHRAPREELAPSELAQRLRAVDYEPFPFGAQEWEKEQFIEQTQKFVKIHLVEMKTKPTPEARLSTYGECMAEHLDEVLTEEQRGALMPREEEAEQDA